MSGLWRALFAVAVIILAIPAAGAAERDIEAGPLWTDIHAQRSCPQVCKGAGAKSWTGQWRTTQIARQSVCTCQFDGNAPVVNRPVPTSPAFGGPIVQVEVGSVSERWARDKCPAACQGKGLRWTGAVANVLGWTARWNCGCAR